MTKRTMDNKKVKEKKQITKESNDNVLKSPNNEMVNFRNETINSNKMKGTYWVLLGLEFVSNNQFNEAIKCFDKAINFNPFNFEAHYQKGKCLVELNRRSEGLEHLEKAFSLKKLEHYLREMKEKENIENNSIPNQIENDLKKVQKKPKIIKKPKKLDKPEKQTLTDEKLDEILLDCLNKNVGIDFDMVKKSYYDNPNYYASQIILPELDSIQTDLNNFSRYKNIFLEFKDQVTETPKLKLENDNKRLLQMDLEPFNIGTSRYLQNDFESVKVDTDIFPSEGGRQEKKVPEDSIIDALINYQKRDIERVLDSLIDQNGGCFYYHVEPQYLLKISKLLLNIVMDDYQMDGVIIAVDRPARMIRKILNISLETKCQPYYIDCNIGLKNFAKTKFNYNESVGTNMTMKDEITFLLKNFNFLDLSEAIEINLQKVAELYEGEHHFVFIDNIAAFQDLIALSEIKKFVKDFAKNLRKLKMYGFFMVPLGSINLSLLDTLRNLSTIISNKVNPEMDYNINPNK